MNEKQLQLTVAEEAFEAMQENLDIAQQTIGYCLGLLDGAPAEVREQLQGVENTLAECIQAHWRWQRAGQGA